MPRISAACWTIFATYVGNQVVRAEPFDAIELELATLWGEASPSPQPTTVCRT